MTLELKITFNGHARGLTQHRLSLLAFARPLEKLVMALQRTASGLVTGKPSSLGAINAEAKAIDLELDMLEHNCVSLKFVARGPESDEGTTDDLTQRSVLKLLEDIEAAVKSGDESNPSAKRYVQSLPPGLESQRYIFTRDGNVLAEIECGTLPHANDDDIPRLVVASGEVSAVGFVPLYVMVKSGDKTLRILCEAQHIDPAYALRNKAVKVAFFQREDGNRLVWLREAGHQPQRPSIEQTLSNGRTHWGTTLEILAQ